MEESLEFCKNLLVYKNNDFSEAVFLEKKNGTWLLVNILSNGKSGKRIEKQIDKEKAKKILELIKSEV
jgi:hypothetical protein